MEEELKKETQEEPEAPQLEERVEQTEDFQTLIRGKYREDFEKALAQALEAQAVQTRRYLAYRELQRQGEALKTRYPDFDLMRELENPDFARLVNNGVDPRTAYEVVHHGELVQAEEARAQNAARPLENGLGPAATATVFQSDPRRLTRQERKLLRKRAARGEEIVW